MRKCWHRCTNVDLWKIKSFLSRAQINGFLSLTALVIKQPIMFPCSTIAYIDYLDPEHFYEWIFIISGRRSPAFLIHTVAARQPASCPLRQAVIITRKALGERGPPPSSSFPCILWRTPKSNTPITWNTFSELVCHYILPTRIRKLALVKELLITGYDSD